MSKKAINKKYKQLKTDLNKAIASAWELREEIEEWADEEEIGLVASGPVKKRKLSNAVHDIRTTLVLLEKAQAIKFTFPKVY